MSDNQETNVDANSQEFRRGVEAGINSEDTKYWQAGYELGQEFNDKETKKQKLDLSGNPEKLAKDWLTIVGPRPAPEPITDPDLELE